MDGVVPVTDLFDQKGFSNDRRWTGRAAGTTGWKQTQSRRRYSCSQHSDLASTDTSGLSTEKESAEVLPQRAVLIGTQIAVFWHMHLPLYCSMLQLQLHAMSDHSRLCWHFAVGMVPHHVAMWLSLKLPGFQVVMPGVIQEHALWRLVVVLAVMTPPSNEGVRTD